MKTTSLSRGVDAQTQPRPSPVTSAAPAPSQPTPATPAALPAVPDHRVSFGPSDKATSDLPRLAVAAAQAGAVGLAALAGGKYQAPDPAVFQALYTDVLAMKPHNHDILSFADCREFLPHWRALLVEAQDAAPQPNGSWRLHDDVWATGSKAWNVRARDYSAYGFIDELLRGNAQQPGLTALVANLRQRLVDFSDDPRVTLAIEDLERLTVALQHSAAAGIPELGTPSFALSALARGLAHITHDGAALLACKELAAVWQPLVNDIDAYNATMTQRAADAREQLLALPLLSGVRAVQLSMVDQLATTLPTAPDTSVSLAGIDKATRSAWVKGIDDLLATTTWSPAAFDMLTTARTRVLAGAA